MSKKKSVEREKIIVAARELFAEKGYAATSIRDIAAAMKMSIAMLYYYFKDKEDLLFSVLSESGIHLLETICNARDQADDPLEGLQLMLIAHISLQKDDAKRARIFVEDMHNLSKKYWKVVYKQHRKIYETYLEQLKLLQEADMLKVEALPLAAFAMLGVVNWTYRWYREDGPLPIESVAEELVQMLSYGILKTDLEDHPLRKLKVGKDTTND